MTTPVTVAGNLTGDPELRFTPAGTAVASFTVAVNRRRKNEAGEWVDADADFVRVVCWRDLATNVAESFEKGSRVLVSGDLRQRRWETDDSPPQKRSTFEVNADEVGASVRWATVEITKAKREHPDTPPVSAYDPDEEPF